MTRTFLIAGTFLLPYFALAGGVGEGALSTTYFTSLLGNIRFIVDNAIPVLIGIAVLVFLWGLVKYITSAGDEEKRKESRQVMIWGLIVIIVMVAVWGLIALFFVVTNINPNIGPYGGPGIPAER